MSPDHRTASGQVGLGRAAFEGRRWADALAALRHAREDHPLEAGDLDRLAWSAALAGDDEVFLDALEELHKLCLDQANPRMAARAAFWLGFRLLGLGASGRATGWLARAQRLVEDEGEDCAERGYLTLPAVFRHLGEGDDVAAEGRAAEAAAIGIRAGDADLTALSRSLLARAMTRQGRCEEGLALVDEVMLSVTRGELSPIMTGIVYCNVIDSLRQVCAVDRAREWTSALASWCEEQPQMVNFTGSCLVHRSEIMQASGDWRGAQEVARLVCDGVCRDNGPEVLADAHYQLAEVLRVRGHLEEAEAAYRLASDNGRDPQPGLALLRLAQGRVAEAANAADRLLAVTHPSWKRARLLPAHVEIMLAAGEFTRAEASVDELERIAREFGTDVLGAMAAHARGVLELERSDPTRAIEALRTAFRVWQRVGAPYVLSRIRVRLARAYGALGDADGERLELDAARRVFTELGARLDLAALEAGDGRGESRPSHGLSARELEVLRLVATGRTNKRIAARLGVSQRTIDRHLSNIFTKLGVSSRTAATAFAFENGLV